MLLLTDGIQRIVPREVDPDDSDDIKALLEAIPGSLVRRELSTSDIVFDELTFERLRKAFQLIKKDVEKLNAGGVCMQIHDSGGFSIEGHTFLHKDKVAARMKEMLSETGLLDPVAEGISESLCSSYLPVPTEASNLILSCIADRIAAREGLDTVTTEVLPFATTALSSMGVSVGRRPGTAEGMILSAIAEASIPKQISSMSVRDFLELRESYCEVRLALQGYLSEICSIQRLARIEDPKILRDRISEVATNFQAACLRHQKSGFTSRIQSWTPFAVSSMFAVSGAYAAPALAGPIVIGSVVVGVLTKAFIEDRHPETVPEGCKLVASLQKGIIKKSTVAALS